MRIVERIVVAVGCGLFVGGWLTRHAEVAILGGSFVLAVGFVRFAEALK